MHDFEWSGSEKKLARRVFEGALSAELEAAMAEFKRLAAAVAEPGEMWELEDFLRRRRGEIDQKYDYRYSQLPLVLGILLREGRTTEAELSGLSYEKLDVIRRVANL